MMAQSEALILNVNILSEVKRLIRAGANVNYMSTGMGEVNGCTTPLINACCGGFSKVVAELIANGAEVNKHVNGYTPLHGASQDERHLPVAEILVSKGAIIDARDGNDGQTPLLKAAFSGCMKLAVFFLDNGADVNAKDFNGFTPLSFVAQNNHFPLVEIFVARGADIHAANVQGVTAVMKAAQQGHIRIVKFLADKGARINQTAVDGGTALGQASLNRHIEVVDFLLTSGAITSPSSAGGLSPLFAAAQDGRLNVVKLLVKRGADIHEGTDQGLNPLQIAALFGHKEVVDYLISKGAEFEARGMPAKACKSCGAFGVTLMKCAGCQTVCYCSTKCQKKDWKEEGENRHKIQCPRLVDIKSRYVEKAKKEIDEKMAQFGFRS